MRVVIQIGYQKAYGRRREGQKVSAWINDMECNWGEENGKYITPRTDAQKGICWFLWSGEVSEKDIIRIEAKTSISGVGVDESRTFEAMYYVTETASVKEIVRFGVGKRGYPLIKGRLMEVGSISEADKREADLDEFLQDDGF